MFNLYGPTETTIFASYHDCTPQLSQPCHDSGIVGNVGGGIDVPIGTPLPNTHFIVVDQFMSPVPVGAGGELVLLGGCLSSGYVGVKEERGFGGNMWGEGRMYRSGDLVRWDEVCCFFFIFIILI